MKLVFCRSNTLGSRLIRLVTWSHWSHIALIDGQEVIEAVWPQVRSIPLGQLLASHDLYEIVEFPTDQDERIMELARSQIGKPYDLCGMLGLGLHRDWQNEAKWWCSELPAWCCQQAGVPFFRPEVLHRIVPNHWWMLAPPEPKKPLRASTRDNVAVLPGPGSISLEKLFEVVMNLSQLLSSHMEKEEKTIREIRDEIHELTSVIHAMPHVEGRPDFYGHRVDHDTIRHGVREINKVRSRFRDRLIDYLIILVIILVSTGKGGELMVKALDLLK